MIAPKTKHTIIIAAVALFIYGCAQSKEAASPSAAPAMAPPAPVSPGADVSGPASPSMQSAPNSAPASVSPAPPETPRPTSPSSEPPNSDRRREAALRTARSEVEAASRELDLATSSVTSSPGAPIRGECELACHALASMERATGHICNLASDESDRRTCDAAKGKLNRARDRIRSTCGTCPDGTSLDPKN